MKIALTPKCMDCGERVPIGNDKDGIPNMVGFQMEDGKVINICSKCISKVGQMPEAEREKYFDDMLRRWNG